MACAGRIAGSDDEGSTGGPGPTGGGATAMAGGASGGGGTGAAAAPRDPGRVTLRRLNRTEYCNTVRDLLGTTSRPCDQFPQDGVSQGFDTIGTALSTSALHFELYETAAGQLVGEVLGAAATDPRRARVVTCDPQKSGEAACAREVLRGFARRAWRRPVTDDELAAYAALIDVAKKQGGTFDDGLRAALQGVLLSPNFLFLVEIDADPKSLTPHDLSDHELAARLSYTLWATMPDDELFRAADASMLRQPATLKAQVRRMLDSPKAQALVTEFGAEWLDLRSLDLHQVDAKLFASYDDAQRDATHEETQRFFADWLQAARPVRDLLASSFSFVNDRLGKFYGVPVTGSTFVRTDVGAVGRRGVLTQAAVLTLTSHPDSTSPTRRGAWVLNQLLCAKPPDPPPNVPALPAAMKAQETLRERLARHRADPGCAVCHNEMDSIGLGLEDFDAIGRKRTVDNGGAIDTRGELPGGKTFSGGLELAGLLADDARFLPCVTRRLMTYALGRALDAPDDDAWVARLTADAQAAGGTLEALVFALTGSAPFRSRRGERSM